MKTNMKTNPKNTGIGVLIFACGIIAGVLGNLAIRKVKNIKILPDNWWEGDDMEDWS